ncbi:TdeIII family type II restriction endonuclease [Candidatus Magnetominusculus dajiuhuensis]|uniref:TdeIII family type II restriction endonuclease n=1 Tax=Candidatus Magnetominusculus dajiuhuensis TaxID=3137712 RepID=UPI003B435E31
MTLSQEQITNVEHVLRNALRRKFQKYNPEPAYMPFHTRLLGKDRLALYSFIHSLNTNFGTSIFEPVALALSSSNYVTAESQQTVGVQISTDAQRVIQNIIDRLATAKTSDIYPNKPDETDAIRSVCTQGEMRPVRLTKADIKLVAHDGTIFFIDLKTAKPNAGEFKGFKRTLLEWVAATLATNPMANVQTLIAIPYNPYEPADYNRWTMRGMLDIDNELKVANEFWDFLGGNGSYQDLLCIFERIGIELRDEIDGYFAKHNY